VPRLVTNGDPRRAAASSKLAREAAEFGIFRTPLNSVRTAAAAVASLARRD
jgi:hypothetical protein